MRLVDEGAEIVGRAVQVGRGEQVDTVVAPAEAAGELGHGHDLDERNAQRGQFRQLTRRRPQRAFGREGADVQFVDHLPRKGRAGPVAVAPGVGAGVDNLRRSMRALRLAAGGRIGIEVPLAEPVAVARTGRGVRHEGGKIAAALGAHRHALRLRGAAGPGRFEAHLDVLPIGRPDAEMHAAAGLKLGADRQAAGEILSRIMGLTADRRSVRVRTRAAAAIHEVLRSPQGCRPSWRSCRPRRATARLRLWPP